MVLAWPMMARRWSLMLQTGPVRGDYQRAAAGMSQRALVANLIHQGFTTRKGTALSLMQVQRIMTQAKIA